MPRLIFRFVLIPLATAACIFLILNVLFPLPDLKPFSTVVNDRQGNLLHAFLAADGRWRLETHPEEIPGKLKTILLHKEDRYFYVHPGVNPFSAGRALIQNIGAGKRISGASTITMQVARMLEPKERTYTAKLAEAFRALQLEWKYSKEEILELYLSMIPLGGNIEGLKSAALLYYQTPLERLNIAQLIDLILIPNDPNGLRPDRDGEALYQERIRKSAEWMRDGLLSVEDSLVIWNTPADARRVAPPRRAPHFSLNAVRNPRGVHEIRSTLDWNIQRTAERLMSSHVRRLKLQGVQNAAVIIVENRTREVLAYIGSPDFGDSTSRGQVDAVRAVRSPGSTLKPFLIAHQMEKGILTPKSVLLDTPYDAEGFYAENYDGTYSGLVSVDAALRKSLNVPFIRTLHDAGVGPFTDHLIELGLRSLETQKKNLGLSMVVGGCGITLEELTSAFLVFPNKGMFSPLRVILRDGDNPVQERQMYSPAVAYMITEILSGLDRPDLPNNFESSVNLPKVAYKTGTSYGRRDAWSVGFSAQYTIGVWVGNADNRGSAELVGSKAAAPLLFDLFNAISSPHLKTLMPMPPDAGIREVCAKSGHLPTPRCQRRIMDHFAVTRTLPVVCDLEREFQIALDRRSHYCSSCLGTHASRTVVYPNYPPELLSFWESNGFRYERIPPHNERCTRVFSGEGPKILSPTDGMTYFRVSTKQHLILHATSGADVEEHAWYFDREFLGRKRAGEKVFLPMKPGEHVITCADEKGRLTTITVLIHDAS